MPLIKDEQEVKRDSQFLKYEVGAMGNSLILKSHLYKTPIHFLQAANRSVACRDEDCFYCINNYPKRAEYNYMIYLNGEIGFIDIKQSVFFAIQGISKAQKKDPRQISWTVIKTGSGLDTEYTVSKEDNLAPEDYERLLEEVDANTDKLVEVMERHEAKLNEAYTALLSTARPQTIKGKTETKKILTEEERADAMHTVESSKKAKKVAEEELPEDEPIGKGDPDQEVSPDQIPF